MVSLINPEKRAEILRPKMLKAGKFLIAKISGSEQEKDPKKLIGNYFRWKQYIGHHTSYEEKWLKSSLKDIWSSNFIGLTPGFMEKPVEEVKKLEFQNPAYSAAFALKGKVGDPRNYSKVFAVQLSGCTYNCNYCYVPAKINLANKDFGKYFSPEEIVNDFNFIRNEEKINVLRITGGEATTIVPEVILDVYHEIEKNDNQIYLWIDTNLSTTKYLERFEGDLRSILRKRNVGVVGCFKGICKEDFSIITGADPRFYSNQSETAKMLIELGADFYLYLPALIYENQIEQRIRNFMEGLQQLNKNLPLRTEVLVIKDYPGAKKNMEEKDKHGRPMPKNDQRLFFDVWYNKILPKYYSKDLLEKFCCEVPL